MSPTRLSKAILHVDADNFFVSCEQALNPTLKGKPVVTGQERGIATAMSPEAKALGITRGMPVFAIKKQFPQVIVLAGDYETYGLFSKRIFSILRRYTEMVEEYGIDEAFADITGLRRVYKMSYISIAKDIQQIIRKEVGITVSIGLAETKTLAKIASNKNKPHGFYHVHPAHIHEFLASLPVENIWGVGKNTAAYMHNLGLTTAYDFISLALTDVRSRFTKPHVALWHELQGQPMYQVMHEEKQRFLSISKTRTFSPSTKDKKIIFAQLMKNVEQACQKARYHNVVAGKVVIMLKTQAFQRYSLEVELSRASSFPYDMMSALKDAFNLIYKPGMTYRSTGVVLSSLQDNHSMQASLFEQPIKITTMKKIYEAVDTITERFGAGAVVHASSLPARKRQNQGPYAGHETLSTTSIKRPFALPLMHTVH